MPLPRPCLPGSRPSPRAAHAAAGSEQWGFQAWVPTVFGGGGLQARTAQVRCAGIRKVGQVSTGESAGERSLRRTLRKAPPRGSSHAP